MRDPLEHTKLDALPIAIGTGVVLLLLVVLGVANPTALGTIAVVFGIILMVMVHEGGHYLTAKWSDMLVTEFFFGFGPRLWSVRRGETEYGVKAIPAGGYVRIIGMNNLDEVDPQDESRAYRSKPFRNRLMVAVAGSFTHFVMAIFLLWIILSGLGVPEAQPIVREIVDDTPAAVAGLEVGDRLVAIDGKPVDEWDDVRRIVQPLGGERTTVMVRRDGQTLELPVTPEDRKLEDGGTAGFLGVAPIIEDVTKGPVAGFGDAVTQTGSIAKESVKALGSFFSPSNLSDYGEALTGQEPAADDTRFLSPVGATQVASQAVQAGLREVLTFLALINIFVGTLNMLPLPPLDGGHVAVATYEKIASAIKRERVQVDMAKIMPIAAVVVIIFLFIGISALYLDIVQPVNVGF